MFCPSCKTCFFRRGDVPGRANKDCNDCKELVRGGDVLEVLAVGVDGGEGLSEVAASAVGGCGGPKRDCKELLSPVAGLDAVAAAIVGGCGGPKRDCKELFLLVAGLDVVAAASIRCGGPKRGCNELVAGLDVVTVAAVVGGGPNKDCSGVNVFAVEVVGGGPNKACKELELLGGGGGLNVCGGANKDATRGNDDFVLGDENIPEKLEDLGGVGSNFFFLVWVVTIKSHKGPMSSIREFPSRQIDLRFVHLRAIDRILAFVKS